MSDYASAEVGLKFITEGLQQLIDARLSRILKRLDEIEQRMAEAEENGGLGEVTNALLDTIATRLEGNEHFTNTVEEIAREVVNHADFDIDIGGISVSVTA